MSDFAIYNNLPRIMPAPAGVKPSDAKPGTSDSFGKLLKNAINQVNDVENRSQTELHKFMNNESDLHSVMIALKKTNLSFQIMMQVRNKIVSAYQEIMKTQV